MAFFLVEEILCMKSVAINSMASAKFFDSYYDLRELCDLLHNFAYPKAHRENNEVKTPQIYEANEMELDYWSYAYFFQCNKRMHCLQYSYLSSIKRCRQAEPSD